MAGAAHISMALAGWPQRVHGVGTGIAYGTIRGPHPLAQWQA